MEWTNCFLCLDRLDNPVQNSKDSSTLSPRNLFHDKRVLKDLLNSDAIFSEFVSVEDEDGSKWVPQSCERCHREMTEILELRFKLDEKLKDLREMILECSKDYGNNHVKTTFLYFFENEAKAGKDFEAKRALLDKFYKFQEAVYTAVFIEGNDPKEGSSLEQTSEDDHFASVKTEPKEIDIKCDPESLAETDDYLLDDNSSREEMESDENRNTEFPPDGTQATDQPPEPPRVIKRRRKRGEPKEMKVKRKPGRPKVEKPPTELPPKIFTCEDCGVKYMSSRTLKDHRNLVHDGKAVTCRVEGCGKKFGSISRMLSHVRQQHANTSIICEECGAKFSSHSGHMQHMAIHQNKKSHVCAYNLCSVCTKFIQTK